MGEWETKSRSERRGDAVDATVEDLEELDECSDESSDPSDDGCACGRCFDADDRCDDEELLTEDLREEQNIVVDLWRPTRPRLVTFENRCYNCVELTDADLMCHGKEDGGVRGYIVLVQNDRGEMFLWHVLETALRSDAVVASNGAPTDDASRLSADSKRLIQIAKRSKTNGYEFDCAQALTNGRLEPALFDRIVERLRVYLECTDAPSSAIRVPKRQADMFVSDAQFQTGNDYRRLAFADWPQFRDGIFERAKKRDVDTTKKRANDDRAFKGDDEQEERERQEEDMEGEEEEEEEEDPKNSEEEEKKEEEGDSGQPSCKKTRVDYPPKKEPAKDSIDK